MTRLFDLTRSRNAIALSLVAGVFSGRGRSGFRTG